MKPAHASLALTLLVVLLAIVGIASIRPPEVPDDAPADRFSADRAERVLQEITREPHPMGSDAHARVREILAAEIEALGLAPEVQTATVAHRYGGPVYAGTVHNVLARLEGREDGRAVVLVSHYDSVPWSPGAGDDGAGVAALLETLRALGEGPPLRNDVIALFTDGEEGGLLGAKAFVDGHPWAADVGMVVNFEARGSRGPSIMFETSSGSGPLVAAFRRAVEDPVAFSYSYEIYKVLPNDTDFTIFRRAGMPGLNFAFIHGPTAYHTAQDSLENLDRRSVQHHGEAALALARHFGDADLDGEPAGGEAVFFNLGPFFVTYPLALVMPLTALLLVGVAAVLWLGFRGRRLRVGPLLLGVLAVLLGAVALGVVLQLLAGPIYGGRYNFAVAGGRASQSLTLLALSLVAVAVTFVLYRLLAKRLGDDALVGAGLVVWALLAAVVAAVAPGASFLFAVPLLAALPAAALWLRDRPQATMRAPLLAALALAAAVAALVWPVTLELVGVALGPTAAFAAGFVVVLVLIGLLAPWLALELPGRWRWVLPAAALVAALVLVVVVRSSARFGPENRRPSNLAYALDAETGEARWYGFDAPPDRWSSSFLGESPDEVSLPPYFGRPRPALAREATPIAREGARVEVVGESREGDGRRLDLRVRWPYDVQKATLFLRSESEIRALHLGGQRIEHRRSLGPGEEPHREMIFFHAPPPDGIVLGVELAGEAPLVIEAIGQIFGLPAPATERPRPADSMPLWAWASDSTFVRAAPVEVTGMAEQAPEEGVDEVEEDEEEKIAA